ncbi:MAG TPA: glutamine--tRNA ligase/YqeY domain fusion protein [Phycisphaerae bacterium]|jgi:glutaminyl-tRNA synthetase|nr:glutamine--tRNA ligase/YqeY domain fusion protein [Phycisphaerae bacterium]HRS27414.1 glutamine--tRNA ligase/YqeY domain fusion protein [Phycisphaerae bacterium]
MNTRDDRENSAKAEAPRRDFIREIIDEHNRTGRFGQRVHTRFPPEPNGYLHIGHAKSICLNYGLAEEYGGKFNLRMDDTNPEKEETEYVNSIIEDVRWLGARWVGMREDDPRAGVLWASNYFDQMYEFAIEAIKKGRAYVCDLTAEEVSRTRGTLTTPGQESPYRNRSVEENLELFERMRRGEVPDGTKTLRAKIDMAHPNLNMRDPVMYRIVHATHHNTGDRWCIYPMYDWAHGFEDSLEGITHSICTLEFENHRPLYDWFIDMINEGRTDDGSGPWGKKIHHPQQIEFARLNLTYTVMSKRRLLQLVKEGHVRGWDDPRMPTVSGMRRRGFTPEAIREFCRRIGVSKVESTVDVALLEHCVREHLNKVCPRVMGVLRPLKLIIDNYPPGQVEWMEAVNNPEDPAAGTRKVPFARELYIEQDDFREVPPPKYWRLYPGNEVRLRYAYFVKCTGCDKDPQTGEITAVHATYDPATRGGDAPDGRKVKTTLHWVSAQHALPVEVRLYDHLFTKPDPDDVSDDAIRAAESGGSAEQQAVEAAAAAKDWKSNLNPKSLETLEAAYVEPSVVDAAPGARYQFERLGYFCVDPDSGNPGASSRRLVFNRTVTLKDEWAKIAKKQ